MNSLIYISILNIYFSPLFLNYCSNSNEKIDCSKNYLIYRKANSGNEYLSGQFSDIFAYSLNEKVVVRVTDNNTLEENLTVLGAGNGFYFLKGELELEGDIPTNYNLEIEKCNSSVDINLESIYKKRMDNFVLSKSFDYYAYSIKNKVFLCQKDNETPIDTLEKLFFPSRILFDRYNNLVAEYFPKSMNGNDIGIVYFNVSSRAQNKIVENEMVIKYCGTKSETELLVSVRPLINIENSVYIKKYYLDKNIFETITTIAGFMDVGNSILVDQSTIYFIGTKGKEERFESDLYCLEISTEKVTRLTFDGATKGELQYFKGSASGN